MLIYFQLIQLQLKTKEYYNPIKKIKIPYTNTRIITPNNNYWKEILQKEFSPHPTNPTNESTNKQIKILYFMFIETIAKQINSKVLATNSIILIKEKYKAYKTLINNIFLNPTTIKQQIQTIFEHTQKHYKALTRFSRIIHNYIKNRPQQNQHKITTDLSLMPLNPTHKHTFIVYENGNSYLFSIPDLIKIIQTAITNAPDFFEKPLQPKNPYTNIPLTTSTLQAFFYKLHKIYYPTPPILEKYYNCQYNLKWFSIQNQMDIRDITIKNFVTNSPPTVLRQEILELIDDYFYDPNTDISIEIDKEFPTHQLINIMLPYLYVFLMGEYHINGSEKQTQAKRVFRKAKQIFMNYNPRFGEQIPLPLPPLPPPQSSPLSKKRKTNQTNQRYRHTQSHQTQGSQQPTPQPTPQPTQPFVFTPAQQSPSTFVFKPPYKKATTNTNQSPTIKPKFFDEHPKFSMNDIEIYLQDPSKLKQLPPIRRPRSPPRPIYMDFDTDDELSETYS